MFDGMAKVSEGEDLVAALARAGEGWVMGVGTVEGVEIRVAGEVRALRGRFSLVSLAGPSGGPFGVVLSRATDTGIETVGGELVRARSLGVELSVPLETRASASAPAQAGGWAAAASATARAVHAAEPEDDEIFPEPGDRVRHFHFGLCDVLMTDHDRLKIRDVEGPGRIREIRTDMLKLTGPIDDDGKRVFTIERKR